MLFRDIGEISGLVAEAAGEKELTKDFEEFRADSTNFSEETIQKNRKLIAEYSDEAGEWLAFAWCGL